MEPEKKSLENGKGDSFWKPSFFRFYVLFRGSKYEAVGTIVIF